MSKHSRAQVEATADSIMSHFIPKNADEKEMSFHFTIPPSSNYKVHYKKDEKDKWTFVDFEVDEKL